MYIYNNKHIKIINQKILNTDCCYYKNIFEHKELASFFLNISIPLDSQNLIGLYIHLEIPHLQLNKDDHIYENYKYAIAKNIKKHFSFHHLNIIRLNRNDFFIVIFNVLEKDIIHCVQSFIKNTQAINIPYFKQIYHFQINCGIYLTQSVISAHDFFTFTKQQYHHTIKHQTSISIYSI